jgi:hypothetical protein
MYIQEQNNLIDYDNDYRPAAAGLITSTKSRRTEKRVRKDNPLSPFFKGE